MENGHKICTKVIRCVLHIKYVYCTSQNTCIGHKMCTGHKICILDIKNGKMDIKHVY
jgi:hypothetical protein